MGGRLTVLLATVTIVCLVSGRSVAQENRLDQLEKRVQQLEQSTRPDHRPEAYALPGFFLLLIGTYCALWARNSGRDPWLWFVAGLLFNVFVFVGVWAMASGDEAKQLKKEKQASQDKVAEPGIVADWPRADGASSHNIKPA